MREQEMLEVAGRLFGQRGYNDVSMEEIARPAEVSKPMVYAYFESKEGLFLACVEAATTELVRTLEEADPGQPAPGRAPLARPARGLHVHRGPPRAPGRSSTLTARRAAGRSRPARPGRTRKIGRLLTEIFLEAAATEGIDARLAAEASEPLAHAMVAAVVGLGAWWMRHPDQPKELQALRMMNLAWLGLGELSRGKLWMPPAEPGPFCVMMSA